MSKDLKNYMDDLSDRIQFRIKLLHIASKFIGGILPIPIDMEDPVKKGIEMIFQGNRQYIEKETVKLEKDIEQYKEFSRAIEKYLNQS